MRLRCEGGRQEARAAETQALGPVLSDRDPWHDARVQSSLPLEVTM
jgi:hypothetical protein